MKLVPILLALGMTVIVVVVNKVTSISLVFSLFLGALGLVSTFGMYLVVANDMHNHIADQARARGISTQAMWLRVCLKSFLIIFVPALVITALLLLATYIYLTYFSK